MKTVEEIARENLNAAAKKARVAEAEHLLGLRVSLNAEMAQVNTRLQELNAGAIARVEIPLDFSDAGRQRIPQRRNQK